MSKKKTTPAPPIVLLITLEPDGNATLLTRRGELACLSQFTYHGLTEVAAAIQAGATQLVELEANPPVIQAEPAPPAPTPEIQPDAETPAAPDEDAALDGVSDESVPQAAMEATPVAVSNDSVFALNVPQPKLF
ncbi:MAG: hypothetical protein ACYDBJ_25845 [Aggregatilineales bacterium]